MTPSTQNIGFLRKGDPLLDRYQIVSVIGRGELVNDLDSQEEGPAAEKPAIIDPPSNEPPKPENSLSAQKKAENAAALPTTPPKVQLSPPKVQPSSHGH